MINGTIRGEIVGRKDWRPVDDKSLYAGFIILKVSGYTDGEKTETEFVCYIPAWMHKRLDFFMKDTTKWCTVVFETITIVESTNTPGTYKIALRASRLEA